ncbi:hypothetical protein HRG84_05360 [Flavisolibacter sp. BT320]|nr:hypothetical protein [Flavisolibacter longurius]
MRFTNLERILPFGYLVLVVLGIIKESVFYYQIGINILKYSNLMDVLISPISDLTSYPIIFIVFVSYMVAVYVLFLYAAKNTNKTWVKKLIDKRGGTETFTIEQIETKLANKFLSVLMVCIMCFFLGIGLGNGKKVADRIAANKLKYNHVLTYNTDESKQVYLIGSNSSNFFYVEEGNSNVKISPVGAIKTIELLKKNYGK